MWAMLKLKFKLMRDNKTLYLIMIGMALLMAGVFSGNMGGSYKSSVAFVGDNNALLSSDLAVGLRERHAINVELMTAEEAKEAVKQRSVVAAITLPEGYPVEGTVEFLTWGETVEYFQLEQAVASEMAKGANLIALTETISDVLKSYTSENLEGVIESAYDTHWRYKRPIDFERVVLEGRFTSYAQNLQAVVGMTLFFLTYSVLFTVGDMLEDQRLRTMDRFVVSSVSRSSILAGNLIPGFFIGMVMLVVMVFAGQYLFNVAWGNAVGAVLGVGTFYVLAIAALSLLVVSVVRTMSQLGVLAPIVLTGMAMIGGCMWPLEIVSSKILLTLSQLTPHKWAMSAITQLVQTGKVTQDTYWAMGVLLAMSVVFFTIGERILYRKSRNALQ